MGIKYYGTERPMSMGAFPKNPADNQLLSVMNFDEKTFCPEIGREAYGYAEYENPLSDADTKDYELTKEGMKLFYCVTSSFDDKGHTIAKITKTIEAEEIPENSSKETSRKTIYNNWFDNYEEAKKFTEDVLKENEPDKPVQSQREYDN